MNKNFPIVFAIVYFGEWPKWFRFYLAACALNPDVHFIFFTNCSIPGTKFENIQFIRMDLTGFNSLASVKLGLTVNISDPYKVCDFKPMFGRIFEDYLEGFDFWGYTDIDLIFGNIRSFISNEVLLNYDIITSKTQYLAGHFTLYRNVAFINNLFSLSKDYKKVMESKEFYSFCECNFLWRYLLAGNSIGNTETEIESMTHIVMRLHEEQGISAYFGCLSLELDQMDKFGRWVADWGEVVLWKDGSLITLSDQKEYLYFHFHVLKRFQDFVIPAWVPGCHSFYMGKDGISYCIEAADMPVTEELPDNRKQL